MTLITDNHKGLYPDSTFVPSDVVPEALPLLVGTQGGYVEGDTPVVRVPLVRDLPDAEFVAEAQPATPSEPTYDELLVSTRKLMVLSRQSREASTHEVAADLLARSMGAALTRKANHSFVNGDSPVGLANIAGITTAGKLGSNLDVLIDAMTGIEVAGGAATDIITDPATWATIAKFKAAADSNVPLVGAPSQVAARSLFGCTVHVSPDVAAGTMLVVDKAAVIVAAGDIQVAVSADAYFESDVIARRVTWRLGWGITDPERIAKITLA